MAIKRRIFEVLEQLSKNNTNTRRRIIDEDIEKGKIEGLPSWLQPRNLICHDGKQNGIMDND